MKKTVIKRRKRVPAAVAAGGSSSSAATSPSNKPGHVRGESTGVRMSDQAAAEALVAVGRLGRRGDDGEESDEEDEEADEGDGGQPPRKRRAAASARRGSAGVPVSLRKTRSHGSVAAGEERRSASVSGRELRKRGSGPAVAAGAGAGGASAGWVTDGGERSESPQQQMGVMRRHHNHHPHIHPALQGEYGQPPRSAGAGAGGQFPPGSFELPPIGSFNGANGMLGMMGLGMGLGGIGGMGLGALGTVAGHHASSYIRSGAPSRSGSPSGLDMMGYIVGGGGVPSVAELERHYAELAEQKRRMEEMVERTERLMSGVRKGIEEMRAGGSRAASPRPGTGQSGSPRLPGQGMGLGHTHVGITSMPRVPSPLGSPSNQVKSQEQQQQENLKMDGIVSSEQHRLSEGAEEEQQHDHHQELERPSMPIEVPLERRTGGGGSVWPVAPSVAE